jgi:hypothetical protein
MIGQAMAKRIDIILEQHTWDIWGYVRNNQGSLDSELACRMIRRGFDDAVAEVCTMLDSVNRQNDRLRREAKELKKQLQSLTEVETFDE